MANLIGFDKNRENVEFREHCKLSINFMSNYLYVQPENEAFKLIAASFKWHYVMKKNLLFVFAGHDFLDFCLVFRSEQICKKTFDYIASGNKDTEVTAEERSIDASFIIPIFQKIAENPTFQASMIETIATWYQLLDEDDKQKYSQMMTDYGIYDLIIAAIPVQPETRQDVASSRKRKFLEVKREVMPKIEMETEYIEETYNTSVPASQFTLIKRQQFRRLIVFTSDKRDRFFVYRAKSKYDKFKCVTCDQTAIIDINKNGDFCVKLENDKHSCKLSTKIPPCYRNVRLIQKPAYEIFQNCAQYSNKILVVFDSDDKTQCCEYFWLEGASVFHCNRCIKAKASKKSAAIIFNDGTSKEFVGIINENHECKTKKFQPKKYQQCYDYVLKPNFEIQQFFRNGRQGKKLIIYDSNDRRKCYRYFYRSIKEKYYCRGCIAERKCVTAKLHQNSEEEEYIILSNTKHVCEMRTYVPPVNNIVLRPPEIEVMEKSKNGLPVVFIFDKNDKTKCYIFNGHHASHYCVGCNAKSMVNRKRKNPVESEKKIVRGNVIKNKETGEYAFQIPPNQNHICAPLPYEPEKYEIQNVSKTYDIFYFRPKKRPKTVRVAIFSSETKELCYTFSYQKSRNDFVCIECQKMKKYYYIKPQKDTDGKEYCNHNVKKHVCQPIKVSTISKSDYLKEHGISFESKSKKKLDESKIVKKPNFELRPNKAGDPDKKLIILHPTDKTMCYEYYFYNGNKDFQCGRCSNKEKIRVSAKLHTDDENGETFILMGKNAHICQPVKYQPL